MIIKVNLDEFIFSFPFSRLRTHQPSLIKARVEPSQLPLIRTEALEMELCFR
jgi:hypothetical protein